MRAGYNRRVATNGVKDERRGRDRFAVGPRNWLREFSRQRGVDC